MKKNKRIIVTVLLIVLLSAVIAAAGKECYDFERRACFSRLTGYTEEIGSDIKRTLESDRNILNGAANIIKQYDISERDEIVKILSSFEGMGLISRLELLLPGGMMLTGDGEILDMSGVLSYQEELSKGVHISKREKDYQNQYNYILRQCVPIERNGENEAIIIGVVDLNKLPVYFPAADYGNETQIYLVERETGNFLQDTQHKTLGNMYGFGDRKTKKGYSSDQFVSDIAAGKSSSAIFLSQTSGEYLYSYVSPVGIQDWMILLSISEDEVFSQANVMMRFFFGLALSFFLIVLIYFIWMIKDVRRENLKMDEQLKNVQYMLEVEKELFDAHLHPENFKRALKKVSDYLTAEAAFFWIINGHSDIKYCYNGSGIDFDIDEDNEMSELFPGLFNILLERGGILSYDMKAVAEEFPVGGKNLAQFNINNLMLIPVSGSGGELTIIFGACNMKRRWESDVPLRQVSLSFFMALNHYEAHYELERLGRIDNLTGLLNRNSFSAALERLSSNKPKSFGCVYIDVNGLHEINNCLGHQAGDDMLKAVADALKRNFGDDGVYRIGGDEFVILSENKTETVISEKIKAVRYELKNQGYALSVGTAWKESFNRYDLIINEAEAKMRDDKRKFYCEGGAVRSSRSLDKQVEKMVLEKQDADAFLSVLAPEFKGVYFVDLDRDTVRHLYIPFYFEKILKETGDVFSKALLLYAARNVRPKYIEYFKSVCDYNGLKMKLSDNITPEFLYQKKDGSWLKLRILKFKNYGENSHETLWIFTDSESEIQN